MGIIHHLSNRLERQRADSRNESAPMASVVENGFTIIATGTTGNFGAYLLDVLLQVPDIRRIVCFNRAEDGGTRQGAAMRARGLEHNLETSRVSYIQVDFTKEYLGLDDATYNDLVEHADLILHNAWPVDFNRNFSSFEPSVNGVKHLIKFCTSSGRTQPCKLVFISSVAASSSWGSASSTSRAKIPESELIDWKLARTGYGQSKLLSERIIAHAARAISLPATIIRVGQLSGPILRGEIGKWPEQEWVPSLIKSSVTMCVLPRTLGPISAIDWVPVDLAAQAVVDIVKHTLEIELKMPAKPTKNAQHACYYHVVNPEISQWSELVTTIQQCLPVEVELVGFSEWITILKEDSDLTDELSNPALKLIDFFDSLRDRATRFPHSVAPRVETTETARVSATIAALPPVSAKWMELWMRQWNWKA